MKDFTLEEQLMAASSTSNEFHRTQKLVQCSTENTDGEKRTRLVEMDNFRLWEYMMGHKHNLKVSDIQPCLWVYSEEYERNEHLYAGAANVRKVNRIVVSVFDGAYGFVHIINRFAPAEDTTQLIEILKSHLRLRTEQGDECDVEVMEGYCVQRWEHEELPPLITGLSC
ncbi:MAG: hypothetical protein ACPGMR_14720 [Pontibacterium sp.]